MFLLTPASAARVSRLTAFSVRSSRITAHLMADSVAEVFKSLEVDVVSELDACGDALTAAVAKARRDAEAAQPTDESPDVQDENE